MKAAAALAFAILAAMLTNAKLIERCDNACQFGVQGACDDGGPGSISSLCTLGSDCDDCGTRFIIENEVAYRAKKSRTPTVFPTKRPSKVKLSKMPTNKPTKRVTQRPTTKAQKNLLCEESCASARNGVCEDGGPSSVSHTCAYGSDCADCGLRDPSLIVVFPSEKTGSPTWMPTLSTKRPSAPTPVSATCNNACAFQSDGECDDGGPGSKTAVCAYGSDCTDCGVRDPLTVHPTSVSPTLNPATLEPTTTAPTNSASPTTALPSASPTTASPSAMPTFAPTREPTTTVPSTLPTTALPSTAPTPKPTREPTTSSPSTAPTPKPTREPTFAPTSMAPTTKAPTRLQAAPTTKSPVTDTQEVWSCNNLCPFAYDGVCDDGGPESAYMLCPYGSDCADCGRRPQATRRPTSAQ